MSFSPLPVRRSSAMTSGASAWLRAAAGDPSREALSRTRTSVSKGRPSRSAAMASRQRTSSSRCSVLTTQKESSTATGPPIVTTWMRVSVVDPAAYTPPYDRALCAALAQAGAEVELVTAPFPHGEVPPARGLHGARGLLSLRTQGPRPALGPAGPAHPRHAARLAPRGRRRALPVAGRAAARPAPAARLQPPARHHRARRAPARAGPGPARRPAPALRAHGRDRRAHRARARRGWSTSSGCRPSACT